MKLVTKKATEILPFNARKQLRHTVETIESHIGLKIGDGPWIAGGFVARTLMFGKVPNESTVDIDIFGSEEMGKNIQNGATLLLDNRATDRYGRRLRRPRGRNGQVQGVYTGSCPSLQSPIQWTMLPCMGVEDVFIDFDLSCCQLSTNGTEIIGTEEAFYDISRSEFWCYFKHASTELRIEKYQKLGLTYRGMNNTVKMPLLDAPFDTKHYQRKIDQLFAPGDSPVVNNPCDSVDIPF